MWWHTLVLTELEVLRQGSLNNSISLYGARYLGWNSSFSVSERHSSGVRASLPILCPHDLSVFLSSCSDWLRTHASLVFCATISVVSPFQFWQLLFGSLQIWRYCWSAILWLGCNCYTHCLNKGLCFEWGHEIWDRQLRPIHVTLQVHSWYSSFIPRNMNAARPTVVVATWSQRG